MQKKNAAPTVKLCWTITAKLRVPVGTSTYVAFILPRTSELVLLGLAHLGDRLLGIISILH